ncbi:DUF5590 domain-containing protein [Streptococcaceae bacterium ESL0729]|nr:DUF5590 domain-containing protein [Streptococcaceae bacterium ESL0729]
MKKSNESLGSQITIGILSLLAVLMLAIIIFTKTSMSPYSQARREAISLARANSSMKEAKVFDIVNTDQTVYSVRGKTESNEDVAVLITAGSKDKDPLDIRTIKLAEGFDPDKLPDASKAKYIRLGLYQDKEVWELRDSLNNYRLYDFKTGEEV